jgi:hypothetical protein
VTYTYDAQNRLVRKCVDEDGDGGAYALVPVRHFVYDGQQIILEFDGAGDLKKRYLWGPAVDQLLAEETFDDGSADDVRWALADHLGTVRDLAVYDPGCR